MQIFASYLFKDNLNSKIRRKDCIYLQINIFEFKFEFNGRFLIFQSMFVKVNHKNVVDYYGIIIKLHLHFYQ
jgi:hypothetical protein